MGDEKEAARETAKRTEIAVFGGANYSVLVPWMMAVADPKEWWKRKRSEAVGGSFAGGVSAEGADAGIQGGAAVGRQRAV